MSQSEPMKTATDLIYLVSCAVNKLTPDARRCAEMDDAAVYSLACRHMLSAAAACALEKVMPLKQHWISAMGNSKRRLVIFQAERTRILKELDERGIWYLPLKGIILKDMYPKAAMREMSDNDILCDASKMKEVRAVMKSLGFTCTEFGIMHHDVYCKKLVCFEMHRTLFNNVEHPEAFAYYRNIKERLIKDADNRCGYHMKDEDFYVYCINHMHKHFSVAGTGLRSLLDIYIINKAKEDSLDRGYISGELDRSGIREYEHKTRRLAEKVFSLQPLTESDKKELAFYVNSGTHGKIENLVVKKLENDDSKKTKRLYLLRRIFPNSDYLELYYPTVHRHRVLYPFLVIYRPFKGLAKKRRSISAELKTLKEYRKTDDNADS